VPILDTTNDENVKKYEEFIKTSPYGHSMQSVNWSHVKKNWESDYVYLEDDKGEIEAAISIISVKNDGEHAFLYAPRGPVCDINNIEIVNQLIEEARPIVEKHNGFLLRMDPEVPYSEELYDFINNNLASDNFSLRSRNIEDEESFSNPRIHMILDVEGRDFDQFMSDWKSNKRRVTRKTYRDNLKTRRISYEDETFSESLDTFYELTKIMAERQEISYRPKDYFERIFEAFDDAVLYETYDEEEVLSSCIVVFYNKKAFYMYSASSDNKRDKNASRQMIVEGIKDTTQKNMDEYDFGGVYNLDMKDGLYNFKRWFTGEKGINEFLGEIDIIYDQKLYDDFIENQIDEE